MYIKHLIETYKLNIKVMADRIRLANLLSDLHTNIEKSTLFVIKTIVLKETVYDEISITKLKITLASNYGFTSASIEAACKFLFSYNTSTVYTIRTNYGIHTINNISANVIKFIPLGKFEMADTVVTQAQYNQFNNIYNDSAQQNCPALFYDLTDIYSYLNWLNAADTDYKYMIPTAKQWLEAADDGMEYSGSNDPYEVGWFFQNSDYKVHPVKTKKANSKQFYDMSGNVWEWCFQLELAKSNFFVIKGGSFLENCKPPSIHYSQTVEHIKLGTKNIGLRLIRTQKYA